MINDLQQVIKNSELSLFADDSTLYKSGTNIKHLSKQIQQDLDSINIWCNQWGFKISSTKSTAVVFTNKTKYQIKLTIDNKDIKIDKTVKFLGLIFDTKLNWVHHIKYITKKCNKKLNLMRYVSGAHWGASKKALLTIYRTLIRSVIDY